MVETALLCYEILSRFLGVDESGTFFTKSVCISKEMHSLLIQGVEFILYPLCDIEDGLSSKVVRKDAIRSL